MIGAEMEVECVAVGQRGSRDCAAMQDGAIEDKMAIQSPTGIEGSEWTHLVDVSYNINEECSLERQ